MGVTVSNMRFMIELDGNQHFQVVFHWNKQHGSDWNCQLARDFAKNWYAVEHDISLLRVEYTEYKDLKKMGGPVFEGVRRTKKVNCFVLESQLVQRAFSKITAV